MSEIKLISPLLDGFVMGDPISDQNGVRCCPAMKDGSDDRFIVKIISNPASQQRLDALLLTGAYPDAQSAKAYFLQQAQDVETEYKVLKDMSQQEGFLGFLDCQTVEMDGGEIGYDVYLLAEYKRTLLRQFNSKPITHLAAINLGLDICSALSVCRRSGYLFADLKPSNIYIVNDGEYKIGDLGFIRLDSLKYASLPDKYRSAYTAPELSDPFACLNTTMDIYALGLILYQAYNGGVLPFAGQCAPAEKFQAPEYADYEMAEIILKACDPDPAQRWQNPVEMGQALVGYMQRNGANDTPIVPPAIPITEPSAAEIGTEESAEQTAELVQDPSSEEIIVPVEEIVSEENPEENSTDEIPADPALEDELPADQPTAPIADAVIAESLDPIDQIVQEFSGEDTMPVFAEDENGNLNFLNGIEDETTQAVDGEDIPYEEISKEVSQMMVQVDDIADHPVPDPVVVPEEVQIPVPDFPAPIDEDASEILASAAATALQDADTPVEDTLQPQSSDEETPAEIEDTEADDAGEEDDDDYDEEELDPPVKSHRIRNIILITAAVLLLAAGFLFYKLYYIQTIDTLNLIGNEHSLTVEVLTDANKDSLTVSCTDAYGNKQVKRLVGNKAEFTELLPATEYRIVVNIDGFYKLDGQVEKSYYTPNRTDMVQLDAVTGSEDGSAIVSFTIDGPDSEQWELTYSSAGESPRTQTFSGHTVNLSGLTVGQVYTLTLRPITGLYMNGGQTITFTASKRILAEDLLITSFKDNTLTAVWNTPEGADVDGWSVVCYNDSGYRQTVTTDQNTYTFADIDTSENYVVEVCAIGQSVVQRTNVAENSITLDPVTAVMNDEGQIVLDWECSSTIPEGGWNVEYSVVGTELTGASVTMENRCVIDAIPGQTYSIAIHSANGNPVVCAPITIETDNADTFSMVIRELTFSATDITFSMCKTPSVANWTRKNLTRDSYTTSFSADEKASFLIKADKYYGISDNALTALYVVYDKEGVPLCESKESFTWKTLWDYFYGELNISQLPSQAGEYTVVVYFNGDIAHQQNFTITE